MAETVLSESVRALLDGSRVAHLATAGRDGRPHVVPLCFVRDQDRLYFVVDEKPKAPGRTLKRLRNIAENPAVALLVDRYDDDDWTRLEYALVHGRAELVGDAAEYARAVALLRARYRQYAEMRLEPGRNALVRIVPDAVHHWKWR